MEQESVVLAEKAEAEDGDVIGRLANTQSASGNSANFL